MMKRMAGIAGYVLLVYVSLVIALYMTQRGFIYFPQKEKPALEQGGIAGMEEITVTTADNLRLFGWYKKPAAATMPTIVWFHGNGGNVRSGAIRAAPFVDAGYGFLIAEYRGYSSNPGKPAEDGLYNDGRAFVEWLKQSGTAENQIILYGESLGAGVAVQMATEFPSIHTLVLEAPFTNLYDMAAQKYPFVPVRWILQDRYDNLTKIENVKAPVIIAHGTDDTLIPYMYGKALFDKASDPKTMITVEGAGHNNLMQFNVTEKVISALTE